jgi:chromate transporter
VHPAIEQFTVFLRLGMTSFGGPVAHVANFHHEIVRRRGWMDGPEFADTVALCQFLPGPTSSQTCFAVGMRRAGLVGGVAAWAGFIAPSAVAMGIAGWWLADGAAVAVAGWLAGLRAFAVAIVLQAVVQMSRTLAPTRRHLALAAGAMLALLASSRLGLPGWLAAAVQPAALAAGALIGARAFRHGAGGSGGRDDAPERSARFHLPRSLSALATLAFVGLLGLTLLSEGAPRMLQAVAVAYRIGALVFGGGHVVLPLAEQPFVQNGWMTQEAVLSGYALVQAMPGPLFTLASYMGAAMQVGTSPPAAAACAALLVTAICLPGLLLVLAALPMWHRMRDAPGMGAAMQGVGCAVLGMLAAALIANVMPAGVTGPGSGVIAAVCAAALFTGRVPVPLLAVLAAAAGHLLLG